MMGNGYAIGHSGTSTSTNWHASSNTITFTSLDTGLITKLTGDVSITFKDPYDDLPVATYDGGPLYVPDCDTFFDSIDDLYDYCADNEMSLSEVKAHPCLTRPVRTPDSGSILEWIEEAWAGEFNEFDGFRFPPEVADAAEALFRQAMMVAPTVWEPQTKVRLILVDEDLDPEYDPEEDTYS